MESRKWFLRVVALLVVLMAVTMVVVYKGTPSERLPAAPPERPAQCPENDHRIFTSMVTTQVLT